MEPLSAGPSAEAAPIVAPRRAVDAYLGLGSRYSYLASTQLDRIAADAGVNFNWIPIVSPDLFTLGRNPFEGPPVSPQYDWRYREADACAWAEYNIMPSRFANRSGGCLSIRPCSFALRLLPARHASQS